MVKLILLVIAALIYEAEYCILYQKFDTCNLKLNNRLPKVKAISLKYIACSPSVRPCKHRFNDKP